MPGYIAEEIILAVGVAAGTVAAYDIYAVVYLSFFYALNKLENLLNGAKASNNPAAPQSFTASGTIYPRMIVYGPTRVSGTAVYECTQLDA